MGYRTRFLLTFLWILVAIVQAVYSRSLYRVDQGGNPKLLFIPSHLILQAYRSGDLYLELLLVPVPLARSQTPTPYRSAKLLLATIVIR